MMNLEQRLTAIIGELIIKHASVSADLEAAQARINELEKYTTKEKKK